MSARECPQRHPETAFRAMGDEGGLVVLSDRREVKVLNPVAIKVFGLLDGTRTIAEISAVVVDEFEVSVEQADSDVRAFLAVLDAQGMLAGPGDSAAKERGE